MVRPGLPSSVVLAVLALLVAGCTSTGEVLSVDLRAAEKDVLVWEVELDGPRPAEQYLEWAETDLQARGHTMQNPYFAHPVYEVLYSFRLGRRQLATVLYRTEATAAVPARGDTPGAVESSASLVHVRTLVYHGEDGELP